MCVWFDSDEPAESSAGEIVERVFVEQIAGGAGGDMVLEGAGVEFLFMMSDRDRKQVAARSFSDEAAQTFEARIAATKMKIETHRRGIALDLGRIDLQCSHTLVPTLRADIFHVCA